MRIQLFKLVYSLFFLLFLVYGVGCTSSETRTDDADGLYQQAEDLYKDEKFLLAIEKFREVKNRYPYSTKALEAELRIADCYFYQESYIEAESSYEIFRELHPTYPRADYVQFQIGLSYYNQIPTVSTRDLSAVYKTMESFEVLVQKYPNSEFAAKAKELQSEARKRLAEHENFVADFYFKRKHYLSASYRYSTLLKDYSGYGFDEEALFRLAICYVHTQMLNNAKDTLNRFLAQYPQSVYRGEAQSILKDL